MKNFFKRFLGKNCFSQEMTEFPPYVEPTAATTSSGFSQELRQPSSFELQQHRGAYRYIPAPPGPSMAVRFFSKSPIGFQPRFLLVRASPRRSSPYVQRGSPPSAQIPPTLKKACAHLVFLRKFFLDKEAPPPPLSLEPLRTFLVFQSNGLSAAMIDMLRYYPMETASIFS